MFSSADWAFTMFALNEFFYCWENICKHAIVVNGLCVLGRQGQFLPRSVSESSSHISADKEQSSQPLCHASSVLDGFQCNSMREMAEISKKMWTPNITNKNLLYKKLTKSLLIIKIIKIFLHSSNFRICLTIGRL